jgi:hypothetical protein
MTNNETWAMRIIGVLLFGCGAAVLAMLVMLAVSIAG